MRRLRALLSVVLPLLRLPLWDLIRWFATIFIAFAITALGTKLPDGLAPPELPLLELPPVDLHFLELLPEGLSLFELVDEKLWSLRLLLV